MIMNCCKFFDVLLKVHYVMAIQKLSMKFIQCDYITFNIVVLSPLSF
jgi:hypothetical protein